MKDAALSVRGLKKDFVLPLTRKRVHAVTDLSFEVQTGSIVGFLGANGAGKTTTLKSILNLIFPDAGEIRIFGKPNSSMEVRNRIGFLTERPYFYDYLSGREFLKFCGQLFRQKVDPTYMAELLSEVGLTEAADRPLRRYSKGMLQRIGIAQALINKPEFLILDEPMSGLDPDGRAEMIQIISRVHKWGCTILFSSHLLWDVETICDRVVMIDKGRLVMQGEVQKILASQTEGYLIEYYDSDKLLSQVIPDESKLQTFIDQLRVQKKVIVKISPKRPSLEDVFLKIKRKGV